MAEERQEPAQQPMDSPTQVAHQQIDLPPAQQMANSLNRIAESMPSREQPLQVAMRHAQTQKTDVNALWVAIRNGANAVAFNRYKNFIDRVLCGEGTPVNEGTILDAKPPVGAGGASVNTSCREDTDSRGSAEERLKAEQGILGELGTHIHGVAAYDLLKLATEVFLLLECGVAIVNRAQPNNAQPNNAEPNNADPNIAEGLFSEEEEKRRLEGWPQEGVGCYLQRLQASLERYLGIGERKLPYLKRIVEILGEERASFPYCIGVLEKKFNCPCLFELMWSYWHEQGMLVQSVGAVSMRFQNRRYTAGRDPLANITIDPLRGLNNLLWGYIQDEQHRLTVPRRAYEYNHEYGLTLSGKAVPKLQPIDARSKFLESFHNLLHACAVFYQEDADMHVIADGFPLLNALKDVHMQLAQGAHNQFGDLPWTARVEMLIQQWLLARPEMREFLPSRPMVPYTEAWMGQVDTMKKLQGWSDVSVTHFHDLGVYGEQILLSVRYTDWIPIINQDEAKNWAHYFRPEIQGYIHSYRAVTGVDLTAEVTEPQQAAARNTPPSVHLRRRLASQAQAR